MTRRQMFQLTKRAIKIGLKTSTAVWLLSAGGVVTLAATPLAVTTIIVTLGPSAVIISTMVGVAWVRKTLRRKKE